MSTTASFVGKDRDTCDLIVDWIPLVGGAMLSTFATTYLPDWARMWLMTMSLYGGFKWLTWRRAIRHLAPSRPPITRSLAYLFLWPGMDAPRFLSGAKPEHRPKNKEWLRAVRNVVAGAVLVWFIAWRFMPRRPSVVGWTGLVGIGLMLHFGLLHLLSLAWRSAGVDARPIMQCPASTTSLVDFWGSRWNTAFRDLAHQLVYRPLARRWGARPAMVAAFLLSGVLHDLAISIPARAGYGLPTLYFILQAIGLEIERSTFGRRWNLRSGMRGWFFAATLILAPVTLLFHPPFIRHVVIPFLKVLGA
jgi:alginate O-acetyltransferase complex protein AlgI